MLGSLEDARLIYQAHHNDTVPDGWCIVGHGSQRTAYLSPGDIVYKVEVILGSNDREHSHFMRIKKAKIKYKGWKVNPVFTYKFPGLGGSLATVIACKYVVGDQAPDTLEYELISQQAFTVFGLLDGHCENYLITKKGRVIIDMGDW